MKTTLLATLVLLISLPIIAQDTTRVLFIGNSITYYNDMPQTFEDIANSKGDTTEITMYAPGGTGFIHHVNDPNVYNHFRQGNWDYVVLQPGSNESTGFSEPIEQTLIRAKILKDSILAYNPCAKILYYEISYGVWGNTPKDLVTYNNTMDLIRSNVEYLSDSTELFFAPAGEAIRTAWNNDQTVMLWVGTGNVHPNAKGSYIIACSIYASIFQKPSFGTSVISTLSPTEASDYQQLADTTVLNNLSSWRINIYNQFTDFTYLVNQSNVDFNSTSQNIDSLQWDFGDGTTSNQPTTTHNFNQTGQYDVILTTYKNGCVETKSKMISILTVSVDDETQSIEPLIYPNPFSEKIIIQNFFNVNEIFIYNILGQEFNNSVSIIKTSKGVEINTSYLPKGFYIVKTKTFANILCK